MPHAGQSPAEQDVPRCVWLFAELHSCCSYSLPWCPIPPCHIQQCLAVSITPHTACRREQVCFFLLLALQQTALGTTAIVIKSLGKYMQIPEVLYKTHSYLASVWWGNKGKAVFLCEQSFTVWEVTLHRTQWCTEDTCAKASCSPQGIAHHLRSF